MTIKRIGHRYSDSKTGVTLDVWFPRANKEIARNCLALQTGLIKSDFVTVEMHRLMMRPPQQRRRIFAFIYCLSVP